MATESQGSNVNLQVQPGDIWTDDEVALLIQLRSSKYSWEQIVRSFPGRNAGSCRRRYQRIFNNTWDRENQIQLARLYKSHKEEMWTKVAEQMSADTSWTLAELNHWCIGQVEMARRAGKEFLSKAPDPVYLLQLEAKLAKNDEAQVQSQKRYQQQGGQGPKNRLWSGDEEAILLAKYREGLQWKDISSSLPGRTLNACRGHNLVLIKRCEGWSPERQNELCKHYDGLKQEMWMHIGETLSVAWQLAEEMHWQLGNDRIAEIAGDPLIHQPAASLTLARPEPDQTTEESFSDETTMWVDDFDGLYPAAEPYNDTVSERCG
ncbi:hypothetical protein E4U23_007391 [Claviceps purpurea]|nr:hypothetical protein E4U23_007391 [Claviceps purpurea]